jgi:nitrogen regulatory protein PII
MNNLELDQIVLLTVIVNCGLGSKVLKIAKANGVTGGTIFLGKGTKKDHLLYYLALDDCRKEIVIIVTNKDNGTIAAKAIEKELKLNKKDHGIAYITAIDFAIGNHKCESLKEQIGKEQKEMYRAIYSIVEKGNGEKVMEAAQKAGAKGGTIMNARGSGIHETSRLFHMDIEPEKEVVLILAKEEDTEKITTAINQELQISEPGKGIVFVQKVEETYGLV